MEDKPTYDKKRAESFMNKRVIIGLTYLDNKGNVMEQKQMHGVIFAADECRGFGVKLGGEYDGKEYWLPPDLRAFQEAPPGEYRFRSTGEVIVDPDLMCTWTITKSAKDEKSG